MDERHPDSTAQLRHWVYTFTIAVSTAVMVGHIFAVRSRDGNTPFLSANDVSRWSTARALVEHGTYAIDDVIRDGPWDTIDKVRHEGRDGQLHYYSSKPPLLATVVAAQYWLITSVTSATFDGHPFVVARTILIVTNVIPLLLYLVLLAKVVERWGETDWGRVIVVIAAAWGTFLTTFAVTLNNHLIASVAAFLAVYAAIRIWFDGARQWWLFGATGLCAGLAAANELPALSLTTVLGAALLWKSPLQTARAFVPAAALVAAAFFGTNYAAHGTWNPPYAQHGVAGGWYDYPDSHWSALRLPAADRPKRDDLQGVDTGEPSRAVYAFHVLVGHHGIFSLTPILLLVPLGIWLHWKRTVRVELAVMVAALSLIVLAFYLGRPQADRNYGGMTSGFRWMFWLTPLWLLVMVPAADWMANSRRARIAVVVLLALSVMSVSIPALNPWQHPWPYQLWRALP